MNIPTNAQIEKRMLKYDRCDMLVNDEETLIIKDQKHRYCWKIWFETADQYEYRRGVFVNGMINPAVELTTAPGAAIFRAYPKAEISDESSLLYQFSQHCTGDKNNQISLVEFMESFACPALRQRGTVFIIMDMPTDKAVSLADNISRGILPYVSIIHPRDVVNWEFDKDGMLSWFAYKVTTMSKIVDPFANNIQQVDNQTRVFDRQNLTIEHSNGGREVIPHNFGFVPVLWQTAYEQSNSQVVGDTQFFTTAKLILSANNFLAMANCEIAKHVSPVLLMSDMSISSMNSIQNADGSVSMKKIFEDQVLSFAGEKEPKFLVKELAAIDYAMKQFQLYMAEAIENEKNARSMQKKGMDGRDVMQSGISRAIERDPIETNIARTSSDCEALHDKILRMANMMIGESTEYMVEYPRDFDMRPYTESIDNVQKFVQSISGSYPSVTGKREMLKMLTPVITKNAETMNKINAELDEAVFDESAQSDAALQDMIDAQRNKGAQDEGGQQGASAPFGQGDQVQK